MRVGRDQAACDRTTLRWEDVANAVDEELDQVAPVDHVHPFRTSREQVASARSPHPAMNFRDAKPDLLCKDSEIPCPRPDGRLQRDQYVLRLEDNHANTLFANRESRKNSIS